MVSHVINTGKFFKDFKLHTHFSSPIHFMFSQSLNLVNILAWNYSVHNKKTSKILVFKVIWRHHELACTLNSVVLSYVNVYYSWNLLWWHSGCIPLGWSGSESVIQDQSGFICSFDAPWFEWPWITDPDNPKGTYSLSLLNFVLSKTSR